MIRKLLAGRSATPLVRDRLIVISWAAVTVFSALLCILASLFWVQFSREHALRAELHQVYAHRSALRDIMDDLRDAETGQRGFLLTGRDRYLVPYRQAEADFEGRLRALRRGRRPLASVAQRLEAPARAKFAELKQSIDVAKAGRQSEALAIVNSDRGQAYMELLRSVISAQRSADEIAIRRHTVRAELAARSTEIAAAGLMLVMIAGLGGAMAVLTASLAQRRRTALRLAESERRHRHLTEAATDMIATLKPDSTIAYVSPACSRVLGYAPEELVGRRTIELTHPEDRPGVTALFSRLREAGPSETTQPYQFRGRHKEGHWIWLEGQPRVDFDAAGRAVAYQDVVRDISTRKRLEMELLAARREAEAAAQAKADFLANMSHELRTPLNSIVGFAGLIASDGELAPETRRRVEIVRDSSRALVALVNDILDVSKFEAEGVSLKPEPVELAPLLAAAVELLRPEAEAKGLALSFHCAAPLGPVLADPSRVRQLVLNLLGNAVKFTPSGSVVLSLSETSGGGLKIAVRDTGIGIPADRLANVFDRFAQADSSTSRTFGGTGLGLSICRAIAEAMAGKIGAESTEGAGSTFWFTLDPVRLEPGFVSPERDPTAPVVVPGRRILLVDDNAHNRELFDALMAGRGLDLAYAADGLHAVNLVREQAFDLVLMDMQMPVMDGLEAARVIRETGQTALPIIALSANVAPEQVNACMAAGMNGHLAKPYTAEAVLRVIAEWTGTAGHSPSTEKGIDAAVLEELEATLGREDLDRFLGKLAVQLRRMQSLLERDDVSASELGGEAHSVRGYAGTLGFAELAEAYAALETASRNEGETRPAADAQRATASALTLIENRLAA